MPDVFVFPGGRLDPEDRRPSGFPENAAGPAPQWDRFSRQCHLPLLRTALRETQEETSLFIAEAPADKARPPGSPSRAAAWRAYGEAGYAPAFHRLSPLARAITPPGLPRRFHTRFYLADGAHALGRIGGNGELRNIGWIPVEETARVPMAGVGQLVLQEALRSLERPNQAKRPLFHWVGDEMRRKA